MEVLFKSLHHINRLENEVIYINTDRYERVSEYILRLLEEITTASNKRICEFTRNTSEVRRTIDEFFHGNYEHHSQNAERLLEAETRAQAEMRLDIEIQKGSLFQTLFRDNNKTYFIISKADHDEFLDDADFSLRQGLPWKKKTFKAALMEIEDNGRISEVKIYDRNNSKYWYEDFLELQPQRNNKHNTSQAFAALDKVFRKYAKKYPADITTLKNTTIGYFRTKRNMNWGDYVNEVWNEYSAVDEEFPREAIIQKLNGLPEQNNFDTSFPVDRSAITVKMKKQTIPIAENVDLLLKDEVNLYNFDPRIINDEKYLVIKSESGYNHFKDRIDELNRAD